MALREAYDTRSAKDAILTVPPTQTPRWYPEDAVTVYRYSPANSDKGEEPTSGLEPLTCSLRVIGQALQGFAQECKSRISKRLSLLRVAECCTVLHSRWYQSGINRSIASSQYSQSGARFYTGWRWWVTWL
jgi:hypothetical protein